MATLIILLGVRGAGKTSVLHSLAGRSGIKILQPSTTRRPREGEHNEYDYVDRWDAAQYAWSIHVGRHTYGMRCTEIDKVASTQTCITVFDPGNVHELERFRSDFEHDIVTVGLDTVSDTEQQRRRVGDDNTRVLDAIQFEHQLEVVRSCDIVFRGDLATVVEAVSELASLVGGRGGVLAKRTIRAFIRAGSLLSNAEDGSVEPASYDLRVGDEAWCQGRAINLSNADPGFAIPPYSYALVKAHEQARFPTFVAGRFDLKVSLFFDGIILSNGPQVDPSYHGPLFCMLFNGSDVKRGITYGRHFTTIEFRTTTATTEGYANQYQLRERLAEFMSENAMQGPGGDILSRIERVDEKNAQFRSRWNAFNGVVLAALVAIGLFAAGWAFVSAERAREAAIEAERAVRTLTNAAGEDAAGSEMGLRSHEPSRTPAPSVGPTREDPSSGGAAGGETPTREGSDVRDTAP